MLCEKILLAITFMLFVGVSHLLAKHVKEGEEPVSIVFAGDIGFDGPVRYYVQHGYNTYNDSFRKIAPYVREADIAVANCESPFVTKKIFKHKAHKGSTSAIYLRADAKSASSLSYAGFDLVTLANNHINDFGDASVNFTVKSLNNAGIKTFGITYGPTYAPQDPVIMEVKAVKIGFLAYCLVEVNPANTDCEELRSRYNAGPAIYRYEDAARDIRKLKNRVDVVIVFMHWGTEYFLEPLTSDVRMSKELTSLGAHVIIGCHSHVLQPHYHRGNQVVAFSLGNFLFPLYIPGNFLKRPQKTESVEFYEKSIAGCMAPTKASRLFRVWINKKGVVKADYLPLSIEFNPSIKCLQPKPIEGARWIEVCGPHDKACMKCL